MNGHVIGMTISPTKDFLYVNVRSWPDNAVPTQAQAPPINENIELKIINLETLELEKKVNLVPNKTLMVAHYTHILRTFFHVF